VLAVRADASAAAAGLQEGDVVVSVGPGAGSASAALRTLESYEKRPRPLLLRVQRDGVLRLVALGAGS